jgi:MoxR-like ATPase
MALQKQVREVFTAPALIDYLQAIETYTRQSPDFVNGRSPRAGLFLLKAARAWADMDGRKEVLPEDVQAVLPSVAGHRLSILVYAKILSRQPRDKAACRILYGWKNADEVYIDGQRCLSFGDLRQQKGKNCGTKTPVKGPAYTHSIHPTNLTV